MTDLQLIETVEGNKGVYTGVEEMQRQAELRNSLYRGIKKVNRKNKLKTLIPIGMIGIGAAIVAYGKKGGK